jgi:hypothetical protein
MSATRGSYTERRETGLDAQHNPLDDMDNVACFATRWEKHRGIGLTTIIWTSIQKVT